MASPDAEVEALKAIVARYFSVYGVIVTPIALTFQVSPQGGSIDGPFDGLRQELVPKNYIPTIARERGETLIHIQRRPPPRFAKLEVNAALLVLTVLTTVFFGGAWNWADYTGKSLPAALVDLEAIGMGALFFSLPLLAILGSHEMGHYVVSRRYKVHASLPFFLPSLPPLGTFGAFISMRDPIPNRRALLDIGVSGPLVGFAIAIPITLAGLALSAANPVPPDLATGDIQVIRTSILFDVLSLFFPLPQTFVMHPLAFAGWVGLFVTAINLLPAGQLDGGHVARALLGNKQHYLSWAAVIALFIMGTAYVGWIIFGFLILMLGVRHPPPLNDITRLDPLRKLVGVAAVAILLLTFIPQPFTPLEVRADFAYEDLSRNPITAISLNLSLGAAAIVRFAVNNTGGARETIGLRIDPDNLDAYGWTIEFESANIERENESVPVLVSLDSVKFVLNATERAVVTIRIQAPAGPAPAKPNLSFFVIGQIEDAGNPKVLQVAIRVV